VSVTLPFDVIVKPEPNRSFKEILGFAQIEGDWIGSSFTEISIIN
jgi:hypothetical protein